MVLTRFGCLAGAQIADKDIILGVAKWSCAKLVSKTPNVMSRKATKCFSYVPTMVFGAISGLKLASFPNQIANKSKLQIDFAEVTIL